MSHFKYRPDIDGLRAIAVLIVVAFHSFPEWLPGGYIGVDVFFVISGFLISSVLFDSLKNNTFSLSDFYSRRIKRIFPALVLILITLLALGWFFFIPEDYEKLGKHIFSGAIFVSNIVSLSEFGYFDDAAEYKPLLHLWSLGIEEQFYIIWPILLWWAWRLKISFSLLIPALLICSFALNIYRSNYNTSFAFFSLQTRAWELMIGASVGYLYFVQSSWKFKFKSIDKSLFSFIGLGLLLVGCSILNRTSKFPGWWALLPTIGTALIIAGSQSWLNRTLLSIKPLVAIGLISYPLYLWHWILLSFFNVLLGHTPSVALRGSLVLASFCLAWLTYRFVEIPVRHSKHSMFITRSLVLSMICIASLSLYIFYASGLVGQTTQPKLKATLALEDCKAHFAVGKLCEFGNQHSTEIILIYGDSHAEHLTTALNQTLGVRYKIIFAYSAGCFLGEDTSTRGSVSSSCAQQISQIKALKKEKIHTVIHAQRWHGYGFTEKEKISQAITEASKVFGLSPEKIIIIGSTADVDLRCEKWNYYFNQSKVRTSCEDLSESKVINEVFLKVTKELHLSTNVYFVYPIEKLCDVSGCKAIDKGTLFYSDSHHLTQEGAMLIMPEIKRIVEN